MTSSIDTTGLDETQPPEGQASTSAVRANFSDIKSNLETAKSEITGLQTKDDALDTELLTLVQDKVHAAVSKTSPDDADELALVDSAASWGLKNLTWANLKSAISSAILSAANVWTAIQDFSASGAYFGGTASGNLFTKYFAGGTFTPVALGITTAGVGTYTDQIGEYTLIGNMCHFTIEISWSAHTGTGALRISGLPETPLQQASVAIYANGLTVDSGTVRVLLAKAITSDEIQLIGLNPLNGGITSIVVDSSVASLLISGTYRYA